MHFSFTKDELCRPKLDYPTFINCTRFLGKIETLLDMKNNDLADYLRDRKDIIDCYQTPYQVYDPSRGKVCKYSPSILAMAKKLHLIYFIYVLEYTQLTQMKGKPPFIVIEGPDFSGKTTQVKTIVEVINNTGYYPNLAKVTKAPDGEIRAYLLSDVSKHIPALSRTLCNLAYMVDKGRAIGIDLSVGIPVVSDRWIGSTYAYQVAGEKLSKVTFKKLVSASDILIPDLIIVLSVNETIINSRRANGRNEINHLDRWDQDKRDRVRKAYESGFDGYIKTNIVHVDGNGTKQQVSSRIRKAVISFLKEYKENV